MSLRIGSKRRKVPFFYYWKIPILSEIKVKNRLMHLDWQIKHYTDLSLNELHDIIRLRLQAFVVEQDCPYQDLDGKDKKCYQLI